MYFDELRLPSLTKDPGVYILSYLLKMGYKYVFILKLFVDSSILFVNLNVLATVKGLRTEIIYYLYKYIMFKMV
jgi:hypothetical protein